MSDRELLERAAKAAGIKGAYSDAIGEDWGRHPGRPGILVHGSCWNPLRDDGAALRLAVKLDFSIHTLPLKIGVSQYGGDGYLGGWLFRGLDNAADWRRAIVLAAAEIAQEKK